MRKQKRKTTKKEEWIDDINTQLKSFSDSSVEVREHKFGVNQVLEDKSYFKS